MTDICQLLLRVGRGGDGRVSFIRSKYQPKGGPDGGAGGDGGDVLLKLNPDLSSLSHLAGKTEISALAGQRGGPKQMRGHRGESVSIALPAGTYVWEVVSNAAAEHRLKLTGGVGKKLSVSQVTRQQYELEYTGGPYPQREETDTVDPTSAAEIAAGGTSVRPASKGWKLLGVIDSEHSEMLVCQGGFGGRGNESFKSSTNRTPLQSEWGSPGEERFIVFELKLLADVGLVGLPNAGKSTLLSILTNARPKIADYPFTTLEPHLGIFKGAEGKEVVVADIPGLIEGANQGKGLGFDFLRHIDHCGVLVYMLAPTIEEISTYASADQMPDLANALVQQYNMIRNELKAYEPTLATKRSLVAVNKCDLISPKIKNKFIMALKQVLPEVMLVSAATGEGIETLSDRFLALV